MFRKALLAVTFVAVSGSLAAAQEHRVELSGTAGWTFSDGVSGGAVGRRRRDFNASTPRTRSRGAPASASWSSPNVEIGGLFNLQSTNLEASGVIEPVELGDQKIYNYHGYFAYNFGDPDAAGAPLLPRRAGRDAVRQPHARARRASGRSAATPSSRPPGRSA